MDWDKLRMFLAVADAGSFTHAGEALNLSQSAVSRQIGALEESLSVPLFHRHARGLERTEQGDLLYQTAKEIFAKLAVTQARLSESRDAAKGLLKITTPVAFGSTWLAPRVNEFLELYPDIRLSIRVDDDELDLAMREADVAIRLTAPKQPDLVQRHLFTFHFHIYASRAYLERHGTPTELDALRAHRLIGYGDHPHPPFPDVNWMLRPSTLDLADRAVLQVNNLLAIKNAVLAGVGVATLPDYMAADNPDLVRLLPEIEAPAVPAYFVYPEELRSSKRIGVLRDFLLSKVQQQTF